MVDSEISAVDQSNKRLLTINSPIEIPFSITWRIFIISILAFIPATILLMYYLFLHSKGYNSIIYLIVIFIMGYIVYGILLSITPMTKIRLTKDYVILSNNIFRTDSCTFSYDQITTIEKELKKDTSLNYLTIKLKSGFKIGLDVDIYGEKNLLKMYEIMIKIV